MTNDHNTTSCRECTPHTRASSYARSMPSAFGQSSAVTNEREVAEAIWRPANDVSTRLRILRSPTL